jgi:PAS domain S-box-containing protein
VQGRILDVNDAYCVMSGYTREELLQMRVQGLEAAESAPETADRMQRIMQGESPMTSIIS